MSSLLESLGAVAAGEHVQAVGGGIVAVVVFLGLLLLCCAGSGKGNGKKE